MTQQNTFHGANLSFPNRSIHFVLTEIIKFRKQLTVRQEGKSISGWNNALNTYLMGELEHLKDSLESITYSPDIQTQAELEASAADTSGSLAANYSATSVHSDNVLMPTGPSRPIVWDLTGADLDIPQVTPESHPNDFFRAFITGLDNFFTALTRLDSRWTPQSITKYESVMMTALLDELYSITQRKGGEENKSDVPTGTLPSHEEGTFAG